MKGLLAEFMGRLIRRWALSSAPDVPSVSMVQERTDGGRTLRLRYEVRNTRGRPTFVALVCPANPSIAVTRVMVDGRDAARVLNGWKASIPASEESFIDVTCVRGGNTDSVQFPADFPAPIRNCRNPIPLTRLSLPEGNPETVFTGVTDEPTGATWLAAEVRFDPVQEADADHRTWGLLRLVGPEWSAFPRNQRETAKRLVEGEIGHMFASTGRFARLELGVAVGKGDAGLYRNARTVIVIDPALLESERGLRECRAMLRWQLSGMLLTGMTRVLGHDGGPLLLALRLRALAAADARDQKTGPAPINSRELVMSQLVSGLPRFDSLTHRDWYTRSLRLADEVERLAGAGEDARGALSALDRDLVGREVESKWMIERLRARGLRWR